MLAGALSADALFSSHHFLSAGEYYHWPDEGDLDSRELPYRELLLATRDSPPTARLDAGIEWLGKWGALRGIKKNKASRILKRFVDVHGRDIERLNRKPLSTLDDNDFQLVGQLAEDLVSRGMRPTAYGKALHFLLPETILMWDDKYVRETYRLWETDSRKTPPLFVRYQLFGWRLLKLISDSEGKAVLDTIRAKHRVVAGCNEPITKLIDELVYDGEGNLQRAVTALGGLDRALSRDIKA